MSVRFGNCTLDLEARRVFRGATAIHLSPKAFELLKLLVEQRPRALSKDDLLAKVWSGVFVSDASLARVVNQIRSGIGDSARRPRMVRTVHGFGYAFIADVEDDGLAAGRQGAQAAAPCVFVCGHREFRLPDGEHIVGREPDVSVWLDSPKVSRRHARVIVDGMRATIEDLASKNGTLVRGEPAAGPKVLHPGDEITVGPFTLVFRIPAEPRSTETAITSRQRKAGRKDRALPGSGTARESR